MTIRPKKLMRVCTQRRVRTEPKGGGGLKRKERKKKKRRLGVQLIKCGQIINMTVKLFMRDGKEIVKRATGKKSKVHPSGVT